MTHLFFVFYFILFYSQEEEGGRFQATNNKNNSNNNSNNSSNNNINHHIGIAAVSATMNENQYNIENLRAALIELAPQLSYQEKKEIAKKDVNIARQILLMVRVAEEPELEKLNAA